MPSPYNVPDRVLLYHITHLRNLPRIVASGGLAAYNILADRDYVSIAHGNIQESRSSVRVPCRAGGTLHDYVPFYFGPRSPMLFAIGKGAVEGYEDGQEPIVHLVVQLSDVLEADLPFVFTNGHAIVAYTDFYDDVTQLDQVDFPLMRQKYWHDVDDDPNRAWRRSAEFLVHERLPWGHVLGVGVMNETIQSAVLDTLDDVGEARPVAVRRHWYY